MKTLSFTLGYLEAKLTFTNKKKKEYVIHFEARAAFFFKAVKISLHKNQDKQQKT
jgi:hypothetical protein